MRKVIRRVHVQQLKIGSIALNPAESHHIRDVLRLTVGTLLELFDDTGATATGPITHITSANVVVLVESIVASPSAAMILTVAAAVPKGDRADWMVEKLTELGVARFIPLITERSVVLPAGKNKIERWERIAIEAAKQSRRSGVMTIAPLTPLQQVIESEKQGWFLSTGDAIAANQAKITSEQTLLIGPEGGWTDAEINRMKTTGFQAVGLTSTVLRIETAAIIAAGVALCLTAVRLPSNNG